MGYFLLRLVRTNDADFCFSKKMQVVSALAKVARRCLHRAQPAADYLAPLKHNKNLPVRGSPQPGRLHLSQHTRALNLKSHIIGANANGMHSWHMLLHCFKVSKTMYPPFTAINKKQPPEKLGAVISCWVNSRLAHRLLSTTNPVAGQLRKPLSL